MRTYVKRVLDADGKIVGEVRTEPVDNVDEHFEVLLTGDEQTPLTREQLNLILSNITRRFATRVLAKRFRSAEDDNGRMGMVRALNAIAQTLSSSMSTEQLSAIEKRLDAIEGKSTETSTCNVIIHECEVES